MTLYHISLTVIFLTTFGLGTFVLLKNPRSRINITWFFMSLCVAIWSLGMFYTLDPNSTTSLFSARWSNYFASLIPLFFTHFCLAFVGLKGRQSKPLIVGYVFNAILAFGVFHPIFIPKVTPKLSFVNYANPGPLYVAYTCMFFYLVIYAHYVLFKHLRAQPAQRKNQMKYILIATITGFLSGVPSFLLVYNIPFEPWTLHFLPLYTFIISYAIVKHHLLDINIVIRRGVIYSMLIACITAFYFGVVYLMSLSFGSTFQMLSGRQSVATTLVAIIMVALLFKPMERRIQKFLDRTFFKETAEAIARENERLRAEMVRAEQTKAISLLASGMAHEIKNPLTAIKTFVEHLDEKHHDAEFRGKFKRIVTAEIEKINSTVHQLLTFAKPQNGHVTDVSVSGLLDDTLELLSNDLVNHRIHVERHYNGADALRGDATQLKQAFLNLFLNSLDAMPSGGQLTVTTDGSNGTAIVTIADTGCGIPAAQLEKIFEPFITTKPSGTGLGLSVVQQIVGQHGGQVTISSTAQQGTHVTLTFARTGQSHP